jgi:site-specific DNA recombinase
MKLLQRNDSPDWPPCKLGGPNWKPNSKWPQHRRRAPPSCWGPYRQQVADLKAFPASQEPDERAQAHALLRQLVEGIVVSPTGPRGPVEFDLYGQLAGLFEVSGPVPASMGAMVAGVGFEPTTFRL